MNGRIISSMVLFAVVTFTIFTICCPWWRFPARWELSSDLRSHWWVSSWGRVEVWEPLCQSRWAALELPNQFAPTLRQVVLTSDYWRPKISAKVSIPHPSLRLLYNRYKFNLNQLNEVYIIISPVRCNACSTCLKANPRPTDFVCALNCRRFLYWSPRYVH